MRLIRELGEEVGERVYPEYHLPEERIELVDERCLDDAVELAVALTESQLARPVPRREP